MKKEYIPSSNGDSITVSGVVATGSDGSVFDASDGLRQLPDGNVVVEGGGAVGGVDDDLGDTGGGATGGPGQGAGADGDGGGRGAGRAVSGGDDGVLVDEGTTAEVGAALLEGDDVGEVAGLGVDTTDDELALLVSGGRSGLGEGGDEGGSGGQGEGAGERSHCE